MLNLKFEKNATPRLGSNPNIVFIVLSLKKIFSVRKSKLVRLNPWL